MGPLGTYMVIKSKGEVHVDLRKSYAENVGSTLQRWGHLLLLTSYLKLQKPTFL